MTINGGDLVVSHNSVRPGCVLFADLFEVKDALAIKGETYQKVEAGRLVLGYRRETFVRETWITSAAECELGTKGIIFRVHLEPHGEWRTTIDVQVPDALKATPPKANAGELSGPVAGSAPAQKLDGWLGSAPKLTCDWAPMERINQRWT